MIKRIKMYKGVSIEQHQGHSLYCAVFEDGSWYGWCDTIESVISHIDTKE